MGPPELLYGECNLEGLSPLGFGIVVIGDRVVLIQGSLPTTLVDHTLYRTRRKNWGYVGGDEGKNGEDKTALKCSIISGVRKYR